MSQDRPGVQVRSPHLPRMLLENVQGHTFGNNMTVQQFSQLVPDQAGHLPVHGHLKVQELSAWFGFDRAVGPLLVSMSACFWNCRTYTPLSS